MRTRRPTGRASSPARSVRPTAPRRSRPTSTIPAFRGVTFDELVDAYYEQARGLVDGGVDILLPETTFDTLNLKAALFAIEKYFADTGIRLPVMASVTITDASGRTLSGQTVEACWNSISHAPLLAVGINCALGAKEMRPHIEELAAHRAGLPQLLSERRPAERARRVRPDAGGRWPRCCANSPANNWLNIVGGCCGTTPDHIRAIAEAVKILPPRDAAGDRAAPAAQRPRAAHRHDRSSNFIMVGERTNVTGSPKFAQLIKAGDLEAGAGHRQAADRRRREHPRRQHGRRAARLREGDDASSSTSSPRSPTSPACRS